MLIAFRASRQAHENFGNKPGASRARRGQAGSSLLEILISLFIMALGMLGAVKMQLNSSQATLTTTHGVTAAALGSEVMEAISSEGSGINWTLSGSTVPANAQSWLNEVKAKIPSASAQICSSCTYPATTAASETCPSVSVAPPIWLVTISWSEHGVTVCRSFQARQ